MSGLGGDRAQNAREENISPCSSPNLELWRFFAIKGCFHIPATTCANRRDSTSAQRRRKEQRSSEESCAVGSRSALTAWRCFRAPIAADMRLLLLQMGRAAEVSSALHDKFGDVHVWFRQALALREGEALDVIVVSEGNQLPSAQEVMAKYSGVLVSGSVKMVTDRLDWSENAAGFLKDLVREPSNKTPVLGVCYGHQLLAHALGGKVQYNSLGRSMGTFQLTLTEAASRDELFSCYNDYSKPIFMHASHMQHVYDAPKDAVVLASNSRDRFHALRFAPRIWGTQFHPEFTCGVLNEHIIARREILIREGRDPDQMVRETREADGAVLLQRFAFICRSRSENRRGNNLAKL